MFPFWESVIEPVLRAAGCNRIVEIGALRGETTVLLLDELGADAQLHVIDPLPQFDPAEHERRFPGRYVFHRDLSHNVLLGLAPMDGALIDGDHNWHTVHRELEMLAETSRAAGTMLPVMVMHDVLWPYGRRDLYYEPGRIPESERQPYRRAGIEPGRSDLSETGGINPSLANATREGGPRNGVMTALDDFAAEHPEPLRIVVLPIYFGLAIVAEERRIAASPALAAEFDRLEGPELRLELLELAESLRLESVVAEHTAVYGERTRLERAADRYLRMVRSALLDEHNIENEARLDYLASCIAEARPPAPVVLRDPGLHLVKQIKRIEAGRKTGIEPPDAGSVPVFPHASTGRDGLEHLQRCLHVIRTESVAGDLAGCGSGRAGEAIFMRAYVEAFEMPGRTVWLLDEFRSPESPVADPLQASRMTDLNAVRRSFSRFGLLDGGVRFLQGAAAARVADPPFSRLALLRIDAGRVSGLADLLEAGYELLSTGGFIVIDGCADPGARAVVEEWCERRAIKPPASTARDRISWRKLETSAIAQVQPAAADPAEETQVQREYPPAVKAGGEAEGSCELSMVVVFHNMRREAERTLLSLSRGYQEGIGDLDYEVIVVENGSTADQLLGEEMVRSFGPQFRYLDLGEESTPSPATALNRGLELARGETIGLMIDGAHVLSPGVLRYAMQGSRNHAPAMVATQQWYVGPGQQVETVGEGYDRVYEDQLFEQIEWPSDGYRLFEVSQFIGIRDWFDSMWESNCLFVPRSALVEVGAFDESFSMPASGLANLDLYERIGASPAINLVTILGEGSFHQLHGGTTTNALDREARERLLARFRIHYAELRGRPFRPIEKAFNYVGSMTRPALRTRARTLRAPAFSETEKLAADRPGLPLPLPEDLNRTFVSAYWHSMRWKNTRWLGRKVAMAPADLLAYQDLIQETRPRWIIEIGRADGGRAMFLASICDLIGHGEVISVGPPADDLPEHPRVTYVEGEHDDREVFARVSEMTGGAQDAFVVFGHAERDTLLRSFDLYSGLVPVDSWVVFEETIMNGHPVQPERGEGPAEAVAIVRRRHLDFEADPRFERLSPSFNPGGYLRRVSG